ncbi:MAG TPA: DUF3107 domain-containing protein [Segeticoccus sp.]|uniref:DUF3107 domain-containing protein n=1 Tax=Segeticoccus sp. TaxID=2706531 RepID=UPI002D80A13F|nr:DUF3107 domain-containing protein [Segeticoccus sp.]HET8599927.1 DUF3107 domain-containing protein [Segeticoccus sp.]
MEVRIGVRDIAREITFESHESADTITEQVSKAVDAGSGVLSFIDERGRRILVPVAGLGYVDLGATERGQVGFGR